MEDLLELTHHILIPIKIYFHPEMNQNKVKKVDFRNQNQCGRISRFHLLYGVQLVPGSV